MIEILIGISGSGKTTYAKQSDSMVISRDGYRNMMYEMENYYLHEDYSDREKLVSSLINKAILANIDKNIIIDATHLREIHLTKYITNYGHLTDIKFRVFERSLNDCIESADRIGHYVSPNVIKRQYEQFKKLKIPKNTVSWKPILQDNTKNKCIIIDLDGTVALRGNRGPFEYSKTLQDKPNTPIIRLIEKYSDTHNLIVCTGREMTQSTKDWIDIYLPSITSIYSRKEGDYRKDYLVKREMWDLIMKDYYIELMVDDRKQVIDAARQLGFTVLDVAGNTF